ncbi:MAG: hypothetical protein H0T89_16595 [Deltaproteobacteria bacterium]|nr:hypothetical protein [Deltaproteobacteria bacterium]MDQ3298986.1 hypothetical protein [Myxococcota bacterium]
MTGSALAQDADVDASADVNVDANASVEPAAEPAAEPMAAEVTVAPGKTLGVDGVFVLPLGDYADAASAAFGALLRFEFGINAALSVTGRAGLLYNLAKADGLTILMIPILGGVKYNIGTSGLFAQAEVGITHIRVSADGGSASETKLSFQGGAGYQMGKIQLRGGLYYIAQDPALMGIMASAGFDFMAL